MNYNETNPCPIEITMQLICKKWRIQILRDMFFGRKRFNEFKEDKPTLSNKVLSNCLKEMEEDNLIKRTKINTTIEYELTDFGKSLNKVLYELAIVTLNNEIGNKLYEEKIRSELEDIFKEKILDKN